MGLTLLSPAFGLLAVAVTIVTAVYGYHLPDDYIRSDRSAAAPSGYKSFLRTSRFAHKVYEAEVTWDDAEAACVKDGAHLSGFDSVEEAKFIEGLVLETIGSAHVWLGARRIAACQKVPRYSNVTTDPCYRGKVFEWKNNVAHKMIPNQLWGVNADHTNPSNEHLSQDALVLYAGDKQKWSIGILDDQQNTNRHQFVCGKYVDGEKAYGRNFTRAH